MPPSGYNQAQAECLREFLLDCARALEAEAAEDGVELTPALDHELRNIRSHLDNTVPSPAQKAVLNLTKAFYELVRSESPSSTEAFRQAAIGPQRAGPQLQVAGQRLGHRLFQLLLAE